MSVTLRDYQREAVKAARDAWADGVQRPAIVLPTGAGKTVVFGDVIAEELREGYSSRVLVLAHRDELIRQAVDKIKSVSPGLRVGIVKGTSDQVGAPVIVGSVQTMRHEARRARVRNVGLVVVDECFPAGTLVGGRPIESLRAGDYVPSYDESTGREVAGRVVSLSKREPAGILVRVWFEDGGNLVCTPGHPLLTEDGWSPAYWLSPGVSVVSFTHDATATGDMHRMRQDLYGDRESEDRYLAPVGADVLLGPVSGSMGEAGPFGAYGAHESSARLGAHAGEQPDVSGGCAGKGGVHACAGASSSGVPGWQRQADPGTAESPGGPARLAGRDDMGAEGWDSTVSLQTGHSTPIDDGVRGGGRGIPLLAGAPRIRPTQGRAYAPRRVARVQVFQPRSDGLYGGLCPDGFVYNIEVATTHTYLVGDGIVAHNCHHATTASYRTVLGHYGCFTDGGTRALGFTATMSRGDGVGLGEVWQSVAYERDIRYMITRKFLVPPRGISVRVEDLDLSTVRRTGGDYNDGQLGEALAASMAPERIVDAYREHALDRPALLFVPTVDFAALMVERFEAAGVTARLVHGAQATEERRTALADFTAGKVSVLVNCMVLTEGADLPLASCVIIGRPTTHVGLYVQMVGRVLRTHPGKTDAIVLDVVGASRRHMLAGLVDLIGERDSQEVGEDGEPIELDDDEPEGRPRRDRDWLDGFLISEEIDLFHGQRARWQRTYGGHWFAPYGKEDIVTVIPSLSGSDAWDVLRVHLRKAGESDWIAREIPDLGYAMAHGESIVLQLPASLARREATWRRKPASEAQRSLLRRCGAVLPPGALSGEASDVLSIVYASDRLDGRVPAARP